MLLISDIIPEGYYALAVDLEHTNPKLNKKFNTIIDSNKNNYRKNIDFEQLWNESKLSVE